MNWWFIFNITERIERCNISLTFTKHDKTQNKKWKWLRLIQAWQYKKRKWILGQTFIDPKVLENKLKPLNTYFFKETNISRPSFVISCHTFQPRHRRPGREAALAMINHTRNDDELHFTLHPVSCGTFTSRPCKDEQEL